MDVSSYTYGGGALICQLGEFNSEVIIICAGSGDYVEVLFDVFVLLTQVFRCYPIV